MAAFTKFNVFTDDLAKGKHNFATNTFKVLLTDTAPVATAKVKADITEIAATGGYTAGGLPTTVALSNSAGTEKVTASNISVQVTSGQTFGPFRYAAVWNATNDALVAWYDYASETQGAGGDTIGINFDQTNGLLQIA